MKFKLILLISVTVMLLSSCKMNPPSQNDMPPEQDITYEQTNVSGTNTIFIKTESGFVPISNVVDGKSRLSGENYYYNLQAVMANEKKLKDKQFTYFGADGKNEGYVTYNEMEKARHSPLEYLYSSGNWKLSPIMRHLTYGKNDTVSDGYKQFIYESFPELFPSLNDVNVTEIWEHDIDGDGTNDAIVKAVGDSYTVLAVLSPVLGNKVVAASTDADKDYTATVFFADIDGDGGFSLIVIGGNTFKTVSVFKQNTLEPDYTVYLPLTK